MGCVGIGLFDYAIVFSLKEALLSDTACNFVRSFFVVAVILNPLKAGGHCSMLLVKENFHASPNRCKKCESIALFFCRLAS